MSIREGHCHCVSHSWQATSNAVASYLKEKRVMDLQQGHNVLDVPDTVLHPSVDDECDCALRNPCQCLRKESVNTIKPDLSETKYVGSGTFSLKEEGDSGVPCVNCWVSCEPSSLEGFHLGGLEADPLGNASRRAAVVCSVYERL